MHRRELGDTGRRVPMRFVEAIDGGISMPHPPPKGIPAPVERVRSRWIFGPFLLCEARRRLDCNGAQVRLGSRSFDILLHLVRHAGEVVGKEDLLAVVWAGLVVEDASVRTHISTLRKALQAATAGQGETREWITSVPLKGYSFIGPVSLQSEQGDVVLLQQPATRVPSSFVRPPVRLASLVGRDEDSERLSAALAQRRLVSVVGTAGMGKTSLAIKVASAHGMSEGEFPREVAFADLAPLASGDRVLAALARSLAVPIDATDTLRLIEQRLDGRRVLLMFDNCEHVIDTVAPIVARLLSNLPELQVLATSREALRIGGEFVYRLPTLVVPPHEPIGLREALQFSAVRLLVERAEAAGAPTFGDADTEALVRISRALDGIPLAIELIASRLSVQSIADLMLRLDDHLQWYSMSTRSGAARHRTLAAALNWSVALLSPLEQCLFRRLSVFRGQFDAASALNLLSDQVPPDRALDVLTNLVGKSLVRFVSFSTAAPYRLLDTTRVYATGLLVDSGESDAVYSVHARHMIEVMNTAVSDLSTMNVERWNERYGHCLDDVRFALDGQDTSQPGQRSLSGELTVASAPLWFHASQIEEFRDRVLAALRNEEARGGADAETVTWLQIALSNTLWHTRGPVPEMQQACERAFSSSLSSGSPLLELQARWARCIFLVASGAYSTGKRQADELHVFALRNNDPAAKNLAHRMMALSSHFCGEFELSRLHGEEALGTSGGTPRMRGNMLQIAANVASRVFLARTLWIQGAANEAIATAEGAMREAQQTGQALSLCFALFGACPVAIWAGDLPRARELVDLMLLESERRGLVYWNQWARCFELGVKILAGEMNDVQLEVDRAAWGQMDQPRREMLVTFSPKFIDDRMVCAVWQGESQWCAAEVWRAAGHRREMDGDLEEAQAHYLRAAEVSRRQGARVWELRAALAQARLWLRAGRQGDAKNALEGALGRCLPGQDFPDRREANALLMRTGNAQ